MKLGACLPLAGGLACIGLAHSGHLSQLLGLCQSTEQMRGMLSSEGRSGQLLCREPPGGQDGRCPHCRPALRGECSLWGPAPHSMCGVNSRECCSNPSTYPHHLAIQDLRALLTCLSSTLGHASCGWGQAQQGVWALLSPTQKRASCLVAWGQLPSHPLYSTRLPLCPSPPHRSTRQPSCQPSNPHSNQQPPCAAFAGL